MAIYVDSVEDDAINWPDYNTEENIRIISKRTLDEYKDI